MEQYERLKKLTGFSDEECEAFLHNCNESKAIAIKFIERIEYDKKGKEEAIQCLKSCGLYEKYLRYKLFGKSDNKISNFNDKCVGSRFAKQKSFLGNKSIIIRENAKEVGVKESREYYPLLSKLIGISHNEVSELLKVKNWTESEAIDRVIDAYENGTLISSLLPELKHCFSTAEAYQKFSEGMQQLNVWRGGESGGKGFVAEHLQALRATTSGTPTIVLNDNGIADLMVKGANGTIEYQQLKVGYEKGIAHLEKYKGQTLILDKSNPRFKEISSVAQQYGINVGEGLVYKWEANFISKAMQWETSLIGGKTAYVVPEVAKIYEITKGPGMDAMKNAAVSTLAISGVSNGIDYLYGNKTAEEAFKELGCDIGKNVLAAGAISVGTTYMLSTEMGVALMETSVGKALGATASFFSGSSVAVVYVGTAVVGVLWQKVISPEIDEYYG